MSTPDIHLRIGRLIVDAGMLEAQPRGLHGLETVLEQALARQLMPMHSDAGLPSALPRAPSLSEQLAGAIGERVTAGLATKPGTT